MAKYHIKSNGEPGVCRATKQCPFGGAEEHYGSREDARAAYEKENYVNMVVEAQKKIEVVTEALPKHLRYADVPYREDEDSKAKAFQEANLLKEAGKFVVVQEVHTEVRSDYGQDEAAEESFYGDPYSGGEGDVEGKSPDAVSVEYRAMGFEGRHEFLTATNGHYNSPLNVEPDSMGAYLEPYKDNSTGAPLTDREVYAGFERDPDEGMTWHSYVKVYHDPSKN